MIRSVCTLALIALLIPTLGCGNKGPLYLPSPGDSSSPDQAEEEQQRRPQDS